MAEVSYYVDEAGDGVLFGPKGRSRLDDPDARRYFMLGKVTCAEPNVIEAQLQQLRHQLYSHPLLQGIYSMKPEAQKTFRSFHAKDDHSDVRLKVFEALLSLDFKFYAVVKDMRKVLAYVQSRNQGSPTYRYQPNELYDFTVRHLFKNRLHKDDKYRIIFARRGNSDRTSAIKNQLELARSEFLASKGISSSSQVDIRPAYPWEQPCLQLADYCLWALQRCYESHEDRFIRAIWHKVSLVHDMDDPEDGRYGTFLTRRGPPPDPQKIKSR